MGLVPHAEGRLRPALGAPGCWEPGTFHAVAAGTGHGKSALSRRLVTAAAEDLVVGWGHEHAKVLIAITEEAPKIIYLAERQPFHHARENVVIADVGASRRRFVHAVCSEADYSVENADGTPGWQIKPGDYVVPTRSEIRGSGVLQNHLTSLSVAHRSRPQKNEKITDPATGRVRLEDDRGRIIFLKTRNGADLKFIPMLFDSNPEGLRGQYYDLLAERAIAGGKLPTAASYTQEGDPILPPRPAHSPFAGIAY